MAHRPPHGFLDYLFASSREAKAMDECNKNYTRGYVYGRGNRDGRRSRGR